MKIKKRIFVGFCIVMLAFILCSCKNPEKQLYGTWETTIDMSKTLEESLGSEFEDFHAAFDLTLYMSLAEDNTFRIYIEKENAAETINAWLDAIKEYSVEMTYKQMEEMGYDRKKTDELYKKQYHTTVRDYLDELIKENMDIDAVVDSATQSGVYKATKNKFYMDAEEINTNTDTYAVYTVDNNTLILDSSPEEEAESEDIIEGLEFPLTFTRVEE